MVSEALFGWSWWEQTESINSFPWAEERVMRFLSCICHLHPIPCYLLLHLKKQIPGGLKGKFSLPLKLGLILASYPEVLPISLSRKSEGDIGLGAERAASASLEAARLRRERGKQQVNDGSFSCRGQIPALPTPCRIIRVVLA